MKKILFILMSMNFGGAERSLLNLLQVLPEKEYDISLMAFQKVGRLTEQVPPHVRMTEAPDDLKRLYGSVKHAGKYAPVKVFGTLMGRIFDGGNFQGHVYRWNHYYKKALQPMQEHYDIAVAYLQGEPIYYLADFVNADRKIAFIHTDYKTSGMRRANDAYSFAAMDALVTISETCVASLKESFPEFKNKIYGLQNITAAKTIRAKADSGQTPEIMPDLFTILSVGRLTQLKGFDMAIDAAAMLKERGRRFRWLILGEGDEREKLQQQIEKCGVGEYVLLPGIRENPYAYMKHADLVVQPSRWEGKSMVLDEAKMIGVPILATNYNTVCNQLTDSVDGSIVEMNAKAIADGIEHLMDHPELRESMKAYQLSQDYDSSAEVSKYIKLFNGD